MCHNAVAASTRTKAATKGLAAPGPDTKAPVADWPPAYQFRRYTAESTSPAASRMETVRPLPGMKLLGQITS